MIIIDSSCSGNYNIGTMSDPYIGGCPEVHGINCPRFTASTPRPPQDPPGGGCGWPFLGIFMPSPGGNWINPHIKDPVMCV